MSASSIWTADVSHGYTRDVAEIGILRLVITTGGAHAFGSNVHVGTVNGDVVAICDTWDACEKAVLRAAKGRLLNTGHDLGKVLP